MEKNIKERIKDTIISAFVLAGAGLVAAWLWIVVSVIVILFEG